MGYHVKEMLISKNRPMEPFKNLRGIVIHSTANIGATALNHFNYWNNADRQSSVHSIADWIGEDILQLIPENEIAYHTGNWQGNREWLGHEMCETNDLAKFKIVWDKTVWHIADVCIRHGWNVEDNVWSHNGLGSLYKGIDHTDPYGYLTRMGKSWRLLCEAIEAEIKRRKATIPSRSVEPSTPPSMPSDHDIYLSVRVLESKSEEVIKQIIKMGYAAKRMELA